MRRLLLALPILFLFCAAANAQMPATCTPSNTYYISSGIGSDSNTQAQARNKATPWAHQPYMNNFTGTYVHTAGDCFIFRGNDTWGAASFGIHIPLGGTSSAADYYGVDLTWFSGASFGRPKFDLAQQFPANGNHLIDTAGASGSGCLNGAGCPGVPWLTFDNIETANNLVHLAGTNVDNTGVMVFGGQHSSAMATGVTVENMFIHDWASTDNSTSTNLFSYGTIYGASVVKNTTISDQNGYGFIGGVKTNTWSSGGCIGCGELKNSIIHHAWVVCSSCTTIHDVESYHIDATALTLNSAIHTHAYYQDGGGPQAQNPHDTIAVYNNYHHDSTVSLIIAVCYNTAVFNNLVDNSSGNVSVELDMCNDDSTSAVGEVVNNTFNTGTNVFNESCWRTPSSTPGLGTIRIQNNFCMPSSGSAGGVNTTHQIIGNNLVLSLAQANGAGYNSANKFKNFPPPGPTSTVNFGVNLTSIATGVLAPLAFDAECAPWSGLSCVQRPTGSTPWDAGWAQSPGSGGVTPPVCTVTAPLPGTYGGSIPFTATSNGGNLSSIQLLIDGIAFGAAGTTTPYSLTFNTMSVVNGAHSLSATCASSSGTSNAPAVAITVSNPKCNTSTAAWTAPIDFGAQTGNFTSQPFTIMPNGIPPTGSGGPIVGFSKNPAAAYSDNSSLIRQDENGHWTVYCNGTGATCNGLAAPGYTALTNVPWSVGRADTFVVSFNMVAQTYDVQVTVNGVSTSIATAFPFRAAATDLEFLNLDPATLPVTLTVCNFLIGPTFSLSLTPNPAAFGNQNVSTTSSPVTVTVTNSGTGSQVMATPYFTITGPNASSFANAGGGTCANGLTVPASGTCTIRMTFTPSTTGALTATLTVQGTVFASDTLTGTGVAPAISIAPSPVAFGNQNVSSTSSPVTVTISNTGTASEILASPFFTITGTNPGDFANAGTGTCANGGTIAASSSCTINLTFTPVASGSRTANLNILGTINALATITGTGLQSAVSLSPTSIAFGNQNTGTSSGNRAVTLTNTGNSTLTITSITLTGTNAGEFSTNGSTCGGTLAASASCSINVVFSPVSAASKTANLTFTTSAPSSPDNVALTGTGTAAALPSLSFSPSPAAFGNQRSGTTSGPLTVTVSNVGTANEILSTPYFAISGPNAASFANLATGTCASSGTIAPSGSCTINLAFTPATTGAMAAVLTVNGTVSGTDTLTGTGVSPIIGLAPTPAAFGNQNVSTTSSPLTVTVSNTGTSTETLSTPFFTITGSNAADFARSGGTCANAGTIAASTSCTIILTFTPAGIGSRSATLTIQGTLNATDSLTGTGIASAVSLAPASIAFGNQTTGTTSTNTAVTLTNTGTATLNITSISLTGANAAEFLTSGSTCGSTLAVSASCGLNVAFSPATTGAKTASLTFTTDAATSPDNIQLTGTGTSVALPSLSFSPTPVAFANQVQGTTSPATTLTVTNTGTANEILSTPYFTITGANATSFSNTGGGTCGNGMSIIPSGSCTMVLTFTPSATGALAGTLNILGTVNGSNGMTGTGTSVTPPIVTLNPTSIAYGNQDDGTSSPPTQVSLTNSGTGSMTISSIVLTGTNASEFSINTNTCGASLGVGASCTWNVVFSPVTAGSKSASVTVTTNAASSPDAVTLTGTGRVPTPPTTPAPAIIIVNVLPPGSVLISDNNSGISPRNVLVSAAGCSQDGITYSTPCSFLISCKNCSASTTVRWNGSIVRQFYASGTITASVPIALIPQPSEATRYQFSLMN